MSRGFWALRRPGWVAAGLIVAIVAMTVGLLRAKSGANTATVLALTVSIASLAVAFRGLWPSPPLSKVARELADRVAQERGSARRQALGMSGDARPAECPTGPRSLMRSRSWCAGALTADLSTAH
jgi:hypothetical protein